MVELANRIGAVQQTIYGTTFDVISQAVPINVAYSPLGLEFHQDLAYYESPPGLQFLHCLRFDKSVVGGESSLSDLFAAAQYMRDNHPAEFKTLCTVPATFAKVCVGGLH